MADKGFEIGFDEARSLMLIDLHGLWDFVLLGRFSAAVALKLTSLKFRGRPFDLMIDATDFPVQPPVLATGFEKLLTLGRQGNTGYTAVLVGSMLGKMQVERALHHERLRGFLDRGEAEAWLVERRAAHDAG